MAHDAVGAPWSQVDLWVSSIKRLMLNPCDVLRVRAVSVFSRGVLCKPVQTVEVGALAVAPVMRW